MAIVQDSWSRRNCARAQN